MRREAGKEGYKIKKQNAKLRSSAIFGKSRENPMNKIDIKIVGQMPIVDNTCSGHLDQSLKEKKNFLMEQ